MEARKQTNKKPSSKPSYVAGDPAYEELAREGLQYLSPEQRQQYLTYERHLQTSRKRQKNYRNNESIRKEVANSGALEVLLNFQSQNFESRREVIQKATDRKLQFSALKIKRAERDGAERQGFTADTTAKIFHACDESKTTVENGENREMQLLERDLEEAKATVEHFSPRKRARDDLEKNHFGKVAAPRTQSASETPNGSPIKLLDETELRTLERLNKDIEIRDPAPPKRPPPPPPPGGPRRQQRQPPPPPPGGPRRQQRQPPPPPPGGPRRQQRQPPPPPGGPRRQQRQPPPPPPGGPRRQQRQPPPPPGNPERSACVSVSPPRKRQKS